MATCMYRQGDLLFVEISVLPEGLVTQASNVIAEGEATGHSHCLLDGRVLSNDLGLVFLETLFTTQVVHQEHRALDLPPGRYRVIRQREYTPEAFREVLD